MPLGLLLSVALISAVSGEDSLPRNMFSAMFSIPLSPCAFTLFTQSKHSVSSMHESSQTASIERYGTSICVLSSV